MTNLTNDAIGAPSPIGQQGEGNVIYGGPTGIDLFMSFNSPSERMIEMVQTAPIKAGIATIDGIGTALLVLHFEGDDPLTMDNPINICLDPRPDAWRIPERGRDEHFAMSIALQDKDGIIRAFRSALIPPKLMSAIEMAQTRHPQPDGVACRNVRRRGRHALPSLAEDARCSARRRQRRPRRIDGTDGRPERPPHPHFIQPIADAGRPARSA